MKQKKHSKVKKQAPSHSWCQDIYNLAAQLGLYAEILRNAPVKSSSPD